MNKGVEILLERMESNPDEFTDGYSTTTVAGHRWKDILEKIHMRMLVIKQEPDVKPYYRHQLDFLSDEDITVLYDKLNTARAEAFTREIMGRLLGSIEFHAPVTTGLLQSGKDYSMAQQQHQWVQEQKRQEAHEQMVSGMQHANPFEKNEKNLQPLDTTWNRVFGKGK